MLYNRSLNCRASGLLEQYDGPKRLIDPFLMEILLATARSSVAFGICMAIPRPDDRWYFAYGSNLDIDQKSDRTGKIRCAIRACLHGFRFAFNKQGSNGNIYANIMPDQDGVVWGVAYLCCPEAINTMDEYEGVLGGHYEHETVTINKNDGIELAALTYVAGPEHICSHGRPKNAYLQKILNGARYHGLPTEYIDAIERAASNV